MIRRGITCKITFSSLIQTLLSVLELHQISCQKSDRSRTVTAGWEFCLYHIDKKSPYPEEFPCSFEPIIAQAYIKYKYKLRNGTEDSKATAICKVENAKQLGELLIGIE